jgi:hypothetical protein
LTWPIFDFALFHDDPRYPVQIPSHYLFNAYSADAFKDTTINGKGFVDVAVDAVRLPVGMYRVKVMLCERAYTGLHFVWDGVTRIEVLRPAWSDGRSLLDYRQQWSAPVPAEVS